MQRLAQCSEVQLLSDAQPLHRLLGPLQMSLQPNKPVVLEGAKGLVDSCWNVIQDLCGHKQVLRYRQLAEAVGFESE